MLFCYRLSEKLWSAYLACGSIAQSHIQTSSDDGLQILHLYFKKTNIYTNFLSKINSDVAWIIPKWVNEWWSFILSSLFIKGLNCCLMFEKSQSHLSGQSSEPQQKVKLRSVNTNGIWIKKIKLAKVFLSFSKSSS